MRETYSERDTGGRERYRERERERERGRGGGGGERDIRTDRQIDVQMTYVTPYFHFENSFEWK